MKFALIAVLAMSTAAFGAVLDFYPNASGDGVTWSDVNNWLDVTTDTKIFPPTSNPLNTYLGAIPTSLEDVYIRTGGTVTYNTTAEARKVIVGGDDYRDASGNEVPMGASQLDINGGMLTLGFSGGDTVIGNEDDGYMNLYDGVVVNTRYLKIGEDSDFTGRYGEVNIYGGTYFATYKNYWGRNIGNTGVFNLHDGVVMISSGNLGRDGAEGYINIMGGTWNARDFWLGDKELGDIDNDGIPEMYTGGGHVDLIAGQLDWRSLPANGGFNINNAKSEVIVRETFTTPSIDGPFGGKISSGGGGSGGALRFEVGDSANGLFDTHGKLDYTNGLIDIIDNTTTPLAPGTVLVLVRTRDYNAGANNGSMNVGQYQLDSYNQLPGAIGQLSVRLVADGSLDGFTEELILTIPEPATLSLLVLGGLAIIRRRRS